MNIHEYQGKEVLRKYGVSVPEGKVALQQRKQLKSREPVKLGLCRKGANPCWRPRQSWWGKDCKTKDEVKEYAEELLGKTLVTHQTGPDGQVIKRLLIEEGCDIKRNTMSGLYLTALLQESF